MPLLTLKIDVDTCRGTREGAITLVRLLQRHKAHATFLYSLGPDHTGWALRRALRPGFLRKVSRTSVVAHYGLKTLMYGVLLPAPDIGMTCADEMRAAQRAGFECGIHSWDHVVWQDNVRKRGAEWTIRQMEQSFERFRTIFGSVPRTHGAAGWQMNEHAFMQLDAFGMAYSSDGRCILNEDGSLADPSGGPHRLQISGKTLACIQLPTTLPTLDELLGRKIHGRIIDESSIAAAILRLTNEKRDHLFTLHAELEGQKLAPIFEQLLNGWREQGYQFASMGDYYQEVKQADLPVKAVQWDTLPGRSGEVIVQA